MADWTVRQAIVCLIGSTCVTLSLSLGGYWIWSQHRQKKLSNEKYKISTIVQTGPEKEALKTSYFAELLGLSYDDPASFYAFDCKQAKRKLLASPLIAHASVSKLSRNAIYIDYEARKPVALLADYNNVGIDREGYLFPISPFFSPKEVPEVYLGLPPFGAPEDSSGREGGRWLSPIQNRYLQLAFEILRFLDASPWREGFRVKRIDVSNAFAASLGQREVVVFTEEEIFLKEGVFSIFPKILRLAPKDFSKQLSNFFLLRRNMEEDYRKILSDCSESQYFAPRIIDLRIPQLAFIENR